MKVYLVIGHFTPTDDDPGPGQGQLDAEVKVEVVPTAEAADQALLWYQDGIIRELDVKVRS